jgi:hypothetical protein
MLRIPQHNFFGFWIAGNGEQYSRICLVLNRGFYRTTRFSGSVKAVSGRVWLHEFKS